MPQVGRFVALDGSWDPALGASRKRKTSPGPPTYKLYMLTSLKFMSQPSLVPEGRRPSMDIQAVQKYKDDNLNAIQSCKKM